MVEIATIILWAVSSKCSYIATIDDHALDVLLAEVKAVQHTRI